MNLPLSKKYLPLFLMAIFTLSLLGSPRPAQAAPYKITVNTSGNGTVDTGHTNLDNVMENGVIFFHFYPAENHYVDHIFLDETKITAAQFGRLTLNSYELNSIKSNHTLTVPFQKYAVITRTK